MMHPTTYINKLVFGSKSKVELWNIIEDQRIYEFKSIGENTTVITIV